MPTIKARKQANGSTRYTAVVRIRRGTTVLHQESRTFTHRTAALSWAKHREVALENPAELTRQRQSTQTLAELIRWYIDTFEIPGAASARQDRCAHPHDRRPDPACAVAPCGGCRPRDRDQRPHLDWRRSASRQERQGASGKPRDRAAGTDRLR
ncbi:MAG: hypothetical protein L0Y72_03380 [Gemmataceae bacterium]|nr:hypothetical protein [Gemmataceae bacterium]